MTFHRSCTVGLALGTILIAALSITLILIGHVATGGAGLLAAAFAGIAAALINVNWQLIEANESACESNAKLLDMNNELNRQVAALRSARKGGQR